MQHKIAYICYWNCLFLEFIQLPKGTAKDYDITIGGKETRSVGGSVDITSTDNYQITSLKSLGILAQENLTTFSVASTSISAGTAMTVKAATNLDIKSEAVGTLLFSGDGSFEHAETIKHKAKSKNIFFHINILLVLVVLLDFSCIYV